MLNAHNTPTQFKVLPVTSFDLVASGVTFARSSVYSAVTAVESEVNLKYKITEP